MARMIPPILDLATKSPGEREIFNRLKKDELTKDWIVLHSLDISVHRQQLQGEADFIVIIPDLGVLCLEVKAHRQIYCHDGKWFLGKDNEGSYRSPFKQASEAMYSLLDLVKEQAPSLSRTLFWSAVVFPYVEFNQRSIEWHPWQVVDRRTYARQSIGISIQSVLQTAWEYVRSRGLESNFIKPSLQDSEAIAELFRPSFEFFESPKQRLKAQFDEIRRFTEEQFSALDAMEENPRVIFEGPAGTGKTLLAIEAARRSVSQGRKVLLICYNRFLGQWLKEQARGYSEKLTCNTLHAHMLTVANIVPREDSTEFWQVDLPELATIELLNDIIAEPPNTRWKFDEIIVDEAQDILREEYLNFLGYSLENGFEAGRWRLFGDFTRQAIYRSADSPLDEFLNNRASGLRYKLGNNCRNTPRVAAFVELYGQLNPRYKTYLREDDDIEPKVYYYNDTNQHELLTSCLERLYSEGYQGDNIVVLSTKSNNHCIASRVNQVPWRDRLHPFGMGGAGTIPYTSIYAYKGLESPAVVVTDVEAIESLLAADIFSLAASRANNRLFVLINAKIKQDVALLVSGMKN